jgi:hypothetical protein
VAGEKRLPAEETRSERIDVRGLFTLRTFSDIEGDLLAFLQAFEAFARDRGKVGEQIIATTIGGNEAEAFRVVEPFNNASGHETAPKQKSN